MKSITLLLVLATLLCGCIVVPPSPYDVARTCSREQASVHGDVRGNSRNYHEEVRTRCEDNAEHRTLASRDYRVANGRQTGTASYDAKDGNNRTRTTAKATADRNGFRYDGKTLQERGSFRFATRLVVETR